mmetsp:Transcript_3980/g.11529  ORF Transcript_3980/g.11529 Transcript_3980/m.11529 type:complete len:250 (-) Transcript_3980:53-802(-)
MLHRRHLPRWRARCREYLDDVLVAMARRLRCGVVAEVIFGIHVRARLHQPLDDVRVPMRSRNHQRSPPVVVRCVDIHPTAVEVLQQRQRAGGSCATHRHGRLNGGRRLLFIRCVRPADGAGSDQHVACFRCQRRLRLIQGRATPSIFRIDIGPRFEERRNDIRVPVGGRDVQRGAPVVVHRVNRDAFAQQALHVLHLPLRGRVEQVDDLYVQLGPASSATRVLQTRFQARLAGPAGAQGSHAVAVRMCR